MGHCRNSPPVPFRDSCPVPCTIEPKLSRGLFSGSSVIREEAFVGAKERAAFFSSLSLFLLTFEVRRKTRDKRPTTIPPSQFSPEPFLSLSLSQTHKLSFSPSVSILLLAHKLTHTHFFFSSSSAPFKSVFSTQLIQ